MIRKKKKKQSRKKSYITLCLLFIFIILTVHQCNTPQQPEKKQSPTEKKETPIPPKKSPVTPTEKFRDLEIPVKIEDTPVKDQTRLIHRKGYTLLYNRKNRIPEWVAWELTSSEAGGKEKRTDRFAEDPDMPGQTATNSDYKRSGYDRGHMAPAGDMGWSKAAMDESFYYSNICPQQNTLNGGIWKDLEELSRKWAVEDSALYIICGPIVDRGFKTIGNNKVAVPQRFYKVILSLYGNKPKAIGFIFENGNTSRPLASYCIPVDSVEKVTGLDFFAPLPDRLETTVEAECSPSDWSWTAKSKRYKRR